MFIVLELLVGTVVVLGWCLGVGTVLCFVYGMILVLYEAFRFVGELLVHRYPWINHNMPSSAANDAVVGIIAGLLASMIVGIMIDGIPHVRKTGQSALQLFFEYKKGS